MSTRREKMPGGEGEALWEAVKKTIKPLRKIAASAGSKSDKHPAKIEKNPPHSPKQKQPVVTAPSPRISSLPPLASLAPRERNRIARGSTGIEARLDLHGYKLAQAKDRLLQFLEQAQAREKSLVLVITGKGTFAPQGMERGVLRREMPLWLSLPEFRALVIGFEPASPTHGGAGALYVRVRRRR
jgi:DNA-nicking Smr family endonuclease